MRTWLTLLLTTCLLSLAPAAAPPPAPPPEVHQFIDQLGDDDAEVRLTAVKKLEAIGEPALRLLRQAGRTHPDADVRLRASVVAAAIHQKYRGELRVFEGHKGWVMRVVLTPDGKHAVSAGDTLRVWELETGKLLRSFGPGGWALDVSRDGKRLLGSCLGQGLVQIFDLDTGRLRVRFTGHTAEAWVATFSPDGKTVISGGYDRTLRVWDAATGKELRRFTNVVDIPRCWAWSPDGKQLAVGHFSNNDFQTSPAVLRIWDVATGKEVRSMPGHTGAITAVSWSKDGKRIATSSFDKTVRVWDATTGKLSLRVAVSEQACDAVAFTGDDRRLVTTGWGSDHLVKVWDLVGRQLASFDGHSANVIAVAPTPDGKRVLSAGADGTLRLWRLPQ